MWHKKPLVSIKVTVVSSNSTWGINYFIFLVLIRRLKKHRYQDHSPSPIHSISVLSTIYSANLYIIMKKKVDEDETKRIVMAQRQRLPINATKGSFAS